MPCFTIILVSELGREKSALKNVVPLKSLEKPLSFMSLIDNSN